MSKSNCTGTERKIVAWARKWHVEDEAEKKVRSPETGRMVILPKFHYLRVTAHKLFDDDIPLYASDSWQPIETAPRDGMPVLLFVMGHDLWVGAVYDSDMSDAQSRRPPATHWLPLPVDRPGRIQESNVKIKGSTNKHDEAVRDGLKKSIAGRFGTVDKPVSVTVPVQIRTAKTVAHRKLPYVVSKADAKILWDIAFDCAVKMINDDNATGEADIVNFRRTLDAVVMKKARGICCGRERRRYGNI